MALSSAYHDKESSGTGIYFYHSLVQLNWQQVTDGLPILSDLGTSPPRPRCRSTGCMMGR